MILLHFALPTPFLSLSLNLFEQYMITYIPRVYLLAFFFFFLIVLAHRRSGFCLRRVVVDESLCLSPGLFLCHLRCCLFPLIFVGRSSSEGLRRKVFVGSFRCESRLVKANFLFIVDHSIVILVLQIKLVVMITYLLNSMPLGFSVLFTDPVYDDDHIFKADVLPNAQ